LWDAYPHGKRDKRRKNIKVEKMQFQLDIDRVNKETYGALYM